VTTPGPFLSTRVFDVDGHVRVEVRGEIDIGTVAEFQDALDVATARGSRVVVDLGAVTFMDSTAINVLARAHGRRPAGHVFVVTAASPMARRLLQLTGLSMLLDESDVESD